MTKEFEEFARGLKKEVMKTINEGNAKNHSTGVTTYANDCFTWVATTNSNGGMMVFGEVDARKDFIPVKVIFSPPVTICFFPDGTKTMARCGEDEEFEKEEGVMACIMKKLFGSRNKFKKLVNSGYEQQAKPVDYHYKKDQWG